jgi:hypothetical protein
MDEYSAQALASRCPSHGLLEKALLEEAAVGELVSFALWTASLLARCGPGSTKELGFELYATDIHHSADGHKSGRILKAIDAQTFGSSEQFTWL